MTDTRVSGVKIVPKTTGGRDWMAGYRDATGGFYDKWYRHNRKDEGKAYDAGYQYARQIGTAKRDQYIIECTGGSYVHS